MRFLTKSEKRATKSCLIIKTDHKKEVKHAGIEEWPHQAAAFHEGVTGEGQLIHGDDPGQGGILDQGDDLVGHGGHNALNHLEQGDLKEDLLLGQSQDLRGLPLARRDPLDSAPVNDREVAGVVDGKGHHCGCHPAGLSVPNVVAQNPRDVHETDELEHQGGSPDNPDQGVAQPAQGGQPAHGAEGNHQPQGQGKQQRQEKDLYCGPQAAQQG